MNWNNRMRNLRRLKLCICTAFILLAMAYGPVKDEADNEAARKPEAKVEWIDLEKVADAMTIVGRRK